MAIRKMYGYRPKGPTHKHNLLFLSKEKRNAFCALRGWIKDCSPEADADAKIKEYWEYIEVNIEEEE